eukprot:symbB.v1.2.010688.t1/scaffold685.1/size172784/6
MFAQAELFSPLTKGEDANENQVLRANGKKALSETDASIILQRWWREHAETQRQLFESLVFELMELRREAAVEVVVRGWAAGCWWCQVSLVDE